MPGLTFDQMAYGIYRDAGMITQAQTGLDPDQKEEIRQLFNRFADALRADGNTVSHISRQVFNIVPGQGDYTIGPGGEFDTDWPDRIERAGIILTNETPQPEYPLRPMTVDEYQDWVLKTQSTNWPRAFWYERAHFYDENGNGPLGIVHFLYVPTDANQCALYLEEVIIPTTATGGEEINFQPGYQEMFETNLAVQLAARHPDSHLSEDTRRRSISSLQLIKNAANRPLQRVSDFTHGAVRSNVFAGNRYGFNW